MAYRYSFSGAAGVRFADRKDGQCAAPLWGSAERIGLVCGKSAAVGHSYCDDCAAAFAAGRPSLKEYLSKMEERL
jgi:hypothetical protein